MNKGKDNLKPNAQRAPGELKAMGAKGGAASGAARRRKRDTKVLIREVLSLTPKTSRKTMESLKKLGYDVAAQGGPTVEMLMHMTIAGNAMAGDLASAKFLMDYGMIPDLKAQIERERIAAIREGRAKVDLTLTDDKAEALKAEVRARLMDDALGIASAEAQTPVGTTA